MCKLSFKVITLYFSLFLTTFNTHSEELLIALGNFEPFFSEKNSPALFKDLIDGVYAYIPQTSVNYQYMLSNARLIAVLNEKLVDGAANIFSDHDITGCLTKPFFRFQDVAITLKSTQLEIKSVTDLADLSIVSFQGAKTLIGTEYRQAILTSKYYQEIAKPMQQAKLLTEGMVDVSIGDKYIFLANFSAWKKEDTNISNYNFHYIFPPFYSSMGFNEQKHCDAFDKALIKFKTSGDYEIVYQKHLQTLGYQTPIQ